MWCDEGTRYGVCITRTGSTYNFVVYAGTVLDYVLHRDDEPIPDDLVRLPPLKALDHAPWILDDTLLKQ